MDNKSKIDFREITKSAVLFSKQKYEEAKKFTSEKAVPKIKETAVIIKGSVSPAVIYFFYKIN